MIFKGAISVYGRPSRLWLTRRVSPTPGTRKKGPTWGPFREILLDPDPILSDQKRRRTAWSCCEAIDSVVWAICERVLSARRFAPSSFEVGNDEGVGTGRQRVDHALREVLAVLHHREVRTEGRGLGAERVGRRLEALQGGIDVGIGVDRESVDAETRRIAASVPAIFSLLVPFSLNCTTRSSLSSRFTPL